jgi:hypothetical protein
VVAYARLSEAVPRRIAALITTSGGFVMRFRTKCFALLAVAVAAMIVTGAALALSGLTYNKSAPLSVGRTAATVTGLVTCDPTDVSVSVGVTLVQGKGRQLVIGSGDETQACPLGGGTVTWTVTATTTPGQTFQPGSATAIVSATNPPTFDSNLSVSGSIKLTSS